MQEKQEGTQKIVFQENDSVEEEEEEIDIVEEPDHQYDVNFWRKEEDVPTGYTFKSKKQIFAKAVDNIKIKLKKGVKFEIDNLEIEILDQRKGQNGAELDVEMIDKKDRGQAVLKIFGPNYRKECTLMINKSKKHDAKFVKILAVLIIKRLLDYFISGQSWNTFFEQKSPQTFKKPKCCVSCTKTFSNDTTLNRHIKKYHIENKVCCDVCEEKFHTERSLNRHKKGHHRSNIFNSNLCEKEVVDKSKFKEHEPVDQNQVSVACSICKKGFNTENILKEHMEGDHMQQKVMCDHCKNVFYDEIDLKNHMSVNHAELLLEKEDQIEEMEIEEVFTKGNPTSALAENDQIKHESMEVDVGGGEDEALKLSNLQDSKVLEKEKKRVKEEIKYEQQKKEKEQRKFDEEKAKLTEANRDKKRKKKLSVKQAKKALKIQKYPANVTEIPKNLKHLVNDGDLQLVVEADGACAANSAAGHLFFDPNSGPKLREDMNKHIVEHWAFYKDKVPFPYVRPVGVRGEKVSFKEGEEEKFIQFLKTDKARFLWSDTEELQVIANLYQVKIKVIKTEGDDYLNPVVLWIYPAEEMKTSRLIPEGCVSDMVLINYSDRHYNLVISKDHDIARYGVLSEREVSVHKNEVKHTDEHKDCKETIKYLQKQLVSLQNELREVRAKREITFKETDDKPMESDVEFLEEIILSNSKIKGYVRDGPQVEARLKQGQNLYECNTCNSTFENQKLLNSHMAKHSKEEQFTCDLCGLGFKSKSELQNHVTAKHEGNNSNKSQDSNFSHSRVSKHSSLDSSKQVICDECGNTFKNLNQLNSHMDKIHSEGEYNCMKCSYQGNTAYTLTKHINITHKIYCHTCDKAYDSKWDLMVHRKKEHYDVIKICRYFLKGNCSFGDEKCVYRHDENAKFNLKCHFCEKVFKTKDELMKHRKEYHAKTVPSYRDHKSGYCQRKEN